MVQPEDVTDHEESFTLEQVRVFDAPAERVFGLLTEPAGLARWWGPHGFTTPEVQVDLRVGGSLRLTMQPPDGESFHLSGEFLQIEPPSRLRFTFRWDEPVPDDRETIVDLALDSLGGRTTVTLTQAAFATQERLELHHSGWADSLERLDAVLRAEGAS
jgi:uncharacterized protein YndB with AHSA1/START domain